MGENSSKEITEEVVEGTAEGTTNVFKKITLDSEEIGLEEVGGSTASEVSEISEPLNTFKVAGTNLPAKPSFWTKVKNVLFYEIKVELTPYQQKIEKEINDFLHQPITWKSLKEAALSEVPITFRGKRVF